jgi:hypothetical protein
MFLHHVQNQIIKIIKYLIIITLINKIKVKSKSIIFNYLQLIVKRYLIKILVLIQITKNITKLHQIIHYIR